MEQGEQSAVQGDVLLSERIGGVLVLTLNRPQARNALNPELKDRLLRAMRDADGDPDVRAVVITGNGPIFCAGMDLKAFAVGAAFGGLTDFYANGIAKPLIAALNGPALGGGFEVALTCDLIIAPDQAWFALPEVKRGLFAAGGGTTLASRIPRAIALEIGLTGEPITASRALQIGLVNKVVPADQVRPEALALADRRERAARRRAHQEADAREPVGRRRGDRGRLPRRRRAGGRAGVRRAAAAGLVREVRKSKAAQPLV